MIEQHVAAPAVMPAQALAHLEPGSRAWLALRRTGIGGSDAAAAVGRSPWRTEFDLYLDKLGDIEDAPPTQAMLWGQRLESLIVQEYANRTGRRVVRPHTTFRSTRHPFMLANLDGIADDTRVLEAKTARTAEGWGEDGTDEIPLAYMLQVQHYMIVVDKPVADVAVLIGGSEFRLYEVPADREVQEALIDREAEFWQRVQTRNPPPIASIDDARKRWGRLGVRGAVVATQDDVDAVTTLHAIADEMHLLAQDADALRMALMQRLGDAGDTLVDGAGVPLVTWKLARAAQRFDLERFAAEHPDLVDAYQRSGVAARRFLLKGPK